MADIAIEIDDKPVLDALKGLPLKWEAFARAAVLGLMKPGIPWRDALAMPVGEADAWLSTDAEILNGPSKKTCVVKRDGSRGKPRR